MSTSTNEILRHGSNKKAYSNAVESMEHKQFKAIFKGQEKKMFCLV